MQCKNLVQLCTFWLQCDNVYVYIPHFTFTLLHELMAGTVLDRFEECYLIHQVCDMGSQSGTAFIEKGGIQPQQSKHLSNTNILWNF